MNNNTETPLKPASNPQRDEVTDDVRLKLKALRRAIRKQKRVDKLNQKKDRSIPTNTNTTSSNSASVRVKLKSKKVPFSEEQYLIPKSGSKRERESENYPTQSTKNIKKHSESNNGDCMSKKSRMDISSNQGNKTSQKDNDGETRIAPNSTKPTSTDEVHSAPIKFPINEECTSISVAPSGRHIIAGFTDGTLRLFDTTGRLWNKQVNSVERSDETDKCVDEVKKELESIFDCDSSDSETEFAPQSAPTKAKNRIVMSKAHQNYGAVACQIHAKGVITSLLMSVDCCEDGSYAFGGVLRGSTELVAVDLSSLEKYHDDYSGNGSDVCILDLIKVHRYSDAKLKGFGACIRLKNTTRPEYRLFTGKGIKNMHIWSFIPPNGSRKEPMWQCLYDTPSNGNTITYLSFRADSNGVLQGISKSDDQKLRIWNLSYEQSLGNKAQSQDKSVIKQLAKKSASEKYPGQERPKRPPYIDVVATENALGVYGPFVFSGGDGMFNKIGVMHLDVEDIQSPFNHTELALPNADGSAADAMGGRRRGRQQRGDLKSVTSISGHSSSVIDVILDLSDGSMAYYSYSKGKPTSIKMLPQESNSDLRKTCVSRCRNAKGNSILTKAVYNPNSTRGSITMKYLSTEDNVHYGFSEPNVKMLSKNPKLTEKNREIDLNQPLSNVLKAAEQKSKIDKDHLKPFEQKSKIDLDGQKLSKNLKLTEKKREIDLNQPLSKVLKAIEVKSKRNLDHVKSTERKGKQDLDGSREGGQKPSKIREHQATKKRKLLTPKPKETEEGKAQKQVGTKEIFEDSKKERQTTERKELAEQHFDSKDDMGKSTSNNVGHSKKKRQIAEKKELPKTAVSPDPSRQRKQLTKQHFDSKDDTGKSISNNVATIGESPPRPRTSGVAVSPEAPVPKALEFSTETTKKPLASIKKFLQAGKVPRPKSKVQSKKSMNKGAKVVVKNTALKVKALKTAKNVKADTVEPKRGGKNLSELDAASVLRKLQSSVGVKCKHNESTKQQGIESATALGTLKRLDLSSFPTYRKSGTFTSIIQSSEPHGIIEKQFAERRNMIMNHRASHERLRNSVFSRVQELINTSGVTNDRKSIESTKSMVEAILCEHEQMKDDMMRRQQMEATALAAKQTLDLYSGRAPEVKISFPFPLMFQNARNVVHKFLYNNARV